MTKCVQLISFEFCRSVPHRKHFLTLSMLGSFYPEPNTLYESYTKLLWLGISWDQFTVQQILVYKTSYGTVCDIQFCLMD